jgi:hypothetical protein
MIFQSMVLKDHIHGELQTNFYINVPFGTIVNIIVCRTCCSSANSGITLNIHIIRTDMCLKELSPIDIMRLKRELDKEININTPLFSDDLSNKYDSFMQLCFVSHSGWEHKEKIKSLYELRQEHNPEWNDDWIPFFDTNNVIEGIKVKERYDELMEYFRKEMCL